jgi:hypothetical protein
MAATDSRSNGGTVGCSVFCALHDEEQLQLRECLEMAVRRVGGWCGMAAGGGVSGVELRVRQLEAT